MMRTVEVEGQTINPAHIVSAEVETRHYMNGSASWLVVKLTDGRTLRRENGWGFDAWATLDRVRAAMAR